MQTESSNDLVFSTYDDVRIHPPVDHTLAIIGAGPAGMAAIEALIAEYCQRGHSANFKLLVFDNTPWFGSGPNYDPAQLITNWLNVPDRQMEIDERPEYPIDEKLMPGFMSYHTWREKNHGADVKGSGVDHFVPRAILGEYLKARFISLASFLHHNGWLHLIDAEVTDLTSSTQSDWRIDTALGEFGADSVLLTIGHQPTVSDEQLRDWKSNMASFENTAAALIENPYPVSPYQNASSTQSGRSVALRGFGLSMIDVVRALTIGRGGRFETVDNHTLEQRYMASGEEPRVVAPFSLDGLPVSPKPLSKTIDDQFEPVEEAHERFDADLRELSSTARDRKPIENMEKIVVAIARLASTVFARFHKDESISVQEAEALLASWVLEQDDAHELFVSQGELPLTAIQKYCAMATGTIKPSLDYIMGQVWRKVHPVLYKRLSHSAMDAESIALVTAQDEKMKRYTFGPPVESIQQLVALASKGLLDLSIANDPSIEQHQGGWTFSSGSKQVEIHTIINTVLASPNLGEVSSELLIKLRERGTLTAFHSELGAAIDTSAQVVSSTSQPLHSRLSLLGRLAKGSLFGTDAILECFGERPGEWAVAELKFMRGLDN